MVEISKKIKVSLDECRMLVLGTQVLISLQFELVFQSAFAEAPLHCRQMVAVGLGFLLLTFILLEWGPAYHRIAANGEFDPGSQAFLTSVIRLALAPLAAAIGIDTFIAFAKLCGQMIGIGMGIAVVLLCAVCWYGIGAMTSKSGSPQVQPMKKEPTADSNGKPPDEELHEKVNQVLTEARVVLPGAQAMLGFQFVTMFTREFDTLPKELKYIHLACLTLIALTVVLLMTPAAFHRIAERGEDSERLVRVAGRLVVGAMIPLALGMSGDFYVIVRKVTDSAIIAGLAGGSALALSVALWFGYTLYKRRQRMRSSHELVGALDHSGHASR